ncbi:MAG: hypothetical protein ABL929_10830 [Ferruginibacter sp.]|nr:hypothetical protein [Ferruginibacter sp.]
MQLLEIILQKQSKRNCEAIIHWIGNNQARFDELFMHYEHGDNRTKQNSSWPLSYCVQHHPFFIKKYIAIIIQILINPTTQISVKRNTIRLLQFVDIPKKHQGILMEICFTYIQNIQEKPAIKASALIVLEKLSNIYPEILPELQLIIQEQMPHETKAFTSIGKLILHKKI